ncbi:hypothetical protein MNB_SV-3-741 [hydrothermal vent metagenome]|uniref:Uncharacterized protein n=1 Tax=hydrothermal vent metagenome TaxID=652676 RepID=A0A1W1BC64_9ZZZZ
MLFANHIHWQGNYDKALKLAQKERKTLLVLVVKKDDVQTLNILKTTFMNQPYIDTMNEKMIAVIVTYEGRNSYPVEMYYATIFPALFFVDATREIFIQQPLYRESITKESLKNLFDQREDNLIW